MSFDSSTWLVHSCVPILIEGNSTKTDNLQVWQDLHCTHLEIGNFGVAELTSSVVAELNIPLTRQVEHQVRMLFDDSIKDVLVSQAGSIVSHEIFLSNLSPQLSPTQLPQSFKLQQYHPGVVSEAKPFAN